MNHSANPITATSLLYTRAAAQRITGRTVERIEVWAIAIQVIPKHGSPRLYSKKIFRRHFADFRKERGSKITHEHIQQIHPRRWAIQSCSDPSKFYAVEWKNADLICSCKDYRLQAEANFRIKCCKHIYAVLNHHFDVRTYLEWQNNYVSLALRQISQNIAPQASGRSSQVIQRRTTTYKRSRKAIANR